jgi:hypothetical protein
VCSSTGICNADNLNGHHSKTFCHISQIKPIFQKSKTKPTPKQEKYLALIFLKTTYKYCFLLKFKGLPFGGLGWGVLY